MEISDAFLYIWAFDSQGFEKGNLKNLLQPWRTRISTNLGILGFQKLAHWLNDTTVNKKVNLKKINKAKILTLGNTVQ